MSEKFQMTLSLPIDPEILNRQMQAASPLLGGKLMIPNYRLCILVPAGEKREIPFKLPSGFYCTRRSPLHFDSDYYRNNITINVSCDGRKINPFPLPLTAPFSVNFGLYYLKKYDVVIELINNATTDANISFMVIPHLMDKELYDTWYFPIVKASQERLTALAKG